MRRVWDCACLTAADIGLPEYGSQIAYWNPSCPVHGIEVDECELCESLSCHHEESLDTEPE